MAGVPICPVAISCDHGIDVLVMVIMVMLEEGRARLYNSNGLAGECFDPY